MPVHTRQHHRELTLLASGFELHFSLHLPYGLLHHPHTGHTAWMRDTHLDHYLHHELIEHTADMIGGNDNHHPAEIYRLAPAGRDLIHPLQQFPEVWRPWLNPDPRPTFVLPLSDPLRPDRHPHVIWRPQHQDVRHLTRLLHETPHHSSILRDPGTRRAHHRRQWHAFQPTTSTANIVFAEDELLNRFEREAARQGAPEAGFFVLPHGLHTLEIACDRLALLSQAGTDLLETSVAPAGVRFHIAQHHTSTLPLEAIIDTLSGDPHVWAGRLDLYFQKLLSPPTPQAA